MSIPLIDLMLRNPPMFDMKTVTVDDDSVYLLDLATRSNMSFLMAQLLDQLVGHQLDLL